MATTLKFGNGTWATKKGSTLAYSDTNNAFKPLPFSFDRASSATRVNKDGLIEVVGSGEPRIDYKDDSKGVLKLEPSRSNLITYSEDFTQWSFKTGVGVSSNEIISVDGSLNGSKIETTANGSRYVGNNYTLSTGDNTFSVFAKKGVNNWVYLNVIKDGTNNWNYTFDLENGLIGQSNSSAYSTTAKIEDYGNGWYRCSITANVTTAGVFTARIYCADSSTDVSTIVGSNVYIYAAQLEQGSYATSYIPTQGQSGGVTRVADVCNNGANEQVINSTEGVLYVETSALSNDLSERRFGLSDGTSSNVVRVGYTSVSNRIIAVVYNGSNQAVMTYTSPDIKQNSKIAVKYKENDFALWVDGVKRSTDTSGSVFSANTLNSLDFNIGGGSHFYSETKDVRVYNTALTDAELQALTTI